MFCLPQNMVSSVTKSIVPEMGYDGYNSFSKRSDYQVNNFGAKICCHPKKHVPRNQYRDKWRLWKYHGLQKKKIPSYKDWADVQSYLLKRYNTTCKEKFQESPMVYSNEQIGYNMSKRKHSYDIEEDIPIKMVRKDHVDHMDPIYMNVNGLNIGIQPLPEKHHLYHQQMPKASFKIPKSLVPKASKPTSKSKAMYCESKFNCNESPVIEDEDEDDIELDNLLIQAELLKPSDSPFYGNMKGNKSNTDLLKTQTDSQQDTQILPPTPPPEESPIKSSNKQSDPVEKPQLSSHQRHLPGSVVSACQTACLKTSKTKDQYEAVSKSKSEPDMPDTNHSKQSEITQKKNQNFTQAISSTSLKPERVKITHGSKDKVQNLNMERGGVGSGGVKIIKTNKNLEVSKTGNLGKSAQRKQNDTKIKDMEKFDTAKSVKSTKQKADEGKIVLLDCSNCKNRTVVYSCSCKKVVYCGTVCQKKHWESEHQYSDDH